MGRDNGAGRKPVVTSCQGLRIQDQELSGLRYGVTAEWPIGEADSQFQLDETARVGCDSVVCQRQLDLFSGD
jgi:hypothetical protein